MKGRRFLPWVGDHEAREAWDEVFSRDVLGAVVLGSATGKFVEYVIAWVVLVSVGPNAGPWWEVYAYLASWAVTIGVGLWIFVKWHEVEESGKEVAEETAEDVGEVVDGAKEALGKSE